MQRVLVMLSSVSVIALVVLLADIVGGVRTPLSVASVGVLAVTLTAYAVVEARLRRELFLKMVSTYAERESFRHERAAATIERV